MHAVLSSQVHSQGYQLLPGRRQPQSSAVIRRLHGRKQVEQALKTHGPVAAPDWSCAIQARAFYTDFVAVVKQKYPMGKVHDGEFGAMMDVQLINDVGTHSVNAAPLIAAPACQLGASDELKLACLHIMESTGGLRSSAYFWLSSQPTAKADK